MENLFNQILKYPLAEEIHGVSQLYAHTDLQREKETLEEHLNKTVYYLKRIYKEKALAVVRKELYDALQLSENLRPFIDEMCFNVFYMHDVGKCNINFQLKKMGNPYFKGICERNSNHALLSAAIYIEYFLNRIKSLGFKKDEGKLARTYMLLNAYIIAKHHGDLQDFWAFEEKLNELYETEKYEPESNVFRLYQAGKGDKFALSKRVLEKLFIGAKEVLDCLEQSYFYIYTKLMYSLLVSCDFYATSFYMEQEEVSDIGILDKPEIWREAYESGDTYKSICKYEKQRKEKPVDLKQTSDINVLRNEMFLEAREQLKLYKDENIFYLEAPTGSGKTNTSIELAMNLLNEPGKNKIFYIFPFNTLVEQTKEALDKAFQANQKCTHAITVVNSITPIAHKEEDCEDENTINYNRMLLDRQFFHYPWVITSHVQFFNLLFGVGREDGVALYQLANSIVILDEVQSYKNAIWTEMIYFFKAYAKILHMKMIIMSATLPKLGKLTLDKEEIPCLIKERNKYFNHPLFKNRVQLDFSLLKEEAVYEPLMEKVIALAKIPHKKILVEFIKKKTAMRFYNDLVNRMEDEEADTRLMLLTGDDSTWERKKSIRYIKDEKSKGVVLIATQLIEAGVDIDMDAGFKDISLLDAEEQFLGRINRSCKKADCWAYFFNLDDANVLYKGDCRKEKEMTLLNDKMQQNLKSKNFELYYEKIFDALKAYNKAYTVHNLEDFKTQSLQGLKYKEVKKRMRLIDEEWYPHTVFLGISIEIEKEGRTYILDGQEVWSRYTALLKDKTLSYAEKKVKLSLLQPEMNCFMWKVKKIDVSYTEQIGDLFYIEEGEKYMENGKFNRELLSGSSYELI